ncbi:MAG: rhomboid family intramembrane serine protease [Bacteroidales bacterium]|nr:rhomboid family intramembrane serine protease [Bacteroidales bacterium]
MRQGIWDEIRNIFRQRNNLSILIFLNLAVFVVVLTINLGFFFAGKTFDVSSWLGVSSNFSVLAHRPWTVLTYMFVHSSFLHILFNLLVLYWFGKMFLEYLSQRQLLGVYLLGGLAGALIFIVAYNIIPLFAVVKNVAFAIGASASIMAIVFAIAVLVPNLPVRLAFIGQMKLKYLAMIIVAIDLLSIPFGNAGGHFAHLGGALMGAIFAICYSKGTDITIPLSRFFTWIGNLFKSQPKTSATSGGRRAETDAEYNRRKAREQREIDKILDKVKESGYSSLTKEEKEKLFSNSNKS